MQKWVIAFTNKKWERQNTTKQKQIKLNFKTKNWKTTKKHHLKNHQNKKTNKTMSLGLLFNAQRELQQPFFRSSFSKKQQEKTGIPMIFGFFEKKARFLPYTGETWRIQRLLPRTMSENALNCTFLFIETLCYCKD